ncbi:expressed protein [Arabidopsis lyrata subsp. lyrata]|uniref:Expressed protein n=1 Tax=Arabidopsis lyrata subsp. lyrata TaxID=81972 RepID=D7MXF9_ARALL|nr:expressed protein [Arabidopsis lyrata subsp. lyrata]
MGSFSLASFSAFFRFSETQDSFSFSCLISLDVFSSFLFSSVLSFLSCSSSPFDDPTLLLKVISFSR